MPGHRQFWISKPDACAMLRLGPAQLDKAWRPLLPASAERKNGRSIEIDAAELQAGWSEMERESRIADDRKRQQTAVMPPLVRLPAHMRELAAFD